MACPGAPGYRAAVHLPILPFDDRLHHLWTWAEAHGPAVFPAAAALVLGVFALGLHHAFQGSLADLRIQQVQKDEILRQTRGRLTVTPESIARTLGVDRFRAAALLEDLTREGLLVRQRQSGGIPSYRLKGS